MVRPSTASSSRQNPTAEIAAPSAYNAVLNGPVVPQIAPAPRPQAYPMIRVRLEDCGTCMFISQFYRPQQPAGSLPVSGWSSALGIHGLKVGRISPGEVPLLGRCPSIA